MPLTYASSWFGRWQRILDRPLVSLVPSLVIVGLSLALVANSVAGPWFGAPKVWAKTKTTLHATDGTKQEITKGTPLSSVEQAEGWTLVSFRRRQGWVKAEDLSEESPAGHAEPPLPRASGPVATLLGSMRSAFIQSAIGPIVLLVLALCWTFSGRLARAGRLWALDVEEATDRVEKSWAQWKQSAPTIELARGLGRQMPSIAFFREQWEEFLECLVDDRGVARNTLQSAAFFKDDEYLQSVRWRMFSFSIVRTLPGIATGLGIIGTFLGIAIGLGRIGGWTEIRGMAQMQPVIAGLASAFWTSIAGVTVAMWLTFRGNAAEGRTLDALHKFRERIDRIFPRVTAEDLLLV